jgi:hypothetical protein
MRSVALVIMFIAAVSPFPDLHGQSAPPSADDRTQSGADAARIVARGEPGLLQHMQQRQSDGQFPMGEVYAQFMAPDDDGVQRPVADLTLLGKFVVPAAPPRKGAKNTPIAIPLDRLPEGIQELLSPDSAWNPQRYTLTFLRRDVVDGTQVSIWDVRALDRDGFTGRLLLDEQAGIVVRWVGSRPRVDAVASRLLGLKEPRHFVYSGFRALVGVDDTAQYFTTDVWIEETATPGGEPHPLARGRFKMWNLGDGLAGTRLEVEGPTPDAGAAQASTPAGADARWTRDVADVVLERLTREGYLAPEGDFETQRCMQVVVNVLEPSKLLDSIDPPVRCRVLITSRIVVRAMWDNTVVISLGGR